MQEFFRFVEEPRRCSYLPQERESLEIRCIARMSLNEYADLLARGYRRFGAQVFRPACRACSKCRSVRIPVQQFVPSGSERRVLRKNAGIRAELHPLLVTPEHIALYNSYHQFMHHHRGWPPRQTTAATYTQEFLSGASNSGRQWLYFDAGRLVGVSLMDIVPNAVSLVYFFYDPKWRAQSPGTFSILNQLIYAKSSGLAYAYLGYWVDECASMRYKGRFRPLEILTRYPADEERPLWKSVEEGEQLP
jgi:arginyl-tRNA--protein-N-Asp/Glu arginylyltransferase